MSTSENQLKPYRIGLIVSGLLNVVLIVLLLVNRGSGNETAVSPTLPPTNQVAAVPSATSLPPTTTATTAPSEIAPTPTAELAEPTPTATQPATATLMATAVPTEPPTPTATLEPTATATATAVPGPDWLRYYNQFRSDAGLPQLTENTSWSAGSQAHSRYMMINSLSAHAEDPNKQGYSAQSDESGQNGNIAISGWDGASDLWAIDYWMSAPFHAVPMLNPRLTQTGFGVYRDSSNSFKMTATLDVSSKRALGAMPANITYPITYPQDGGEIWVLRYTLPEFPNPLTACSGLQKPVGPPIILQIGDGSLVPSVTQTLLTNSSGTALPHCAIDETRYVNSNAYQQQQGRNVLDKQDAIVLIPAQPLTVGETYTASVTVNGQTIQWSFTAVSPPTDY
ncbi:MAG: CAP domain-containing protein [Ardenticatenaceae bacterium]|nr:CAP domain-containing protein [Anaerolineales bacterium]MCB8979524.1 CAP domain-containing protein [Ardenticatenaceae bacterium]